MLKIGKVKMLKERRYIENLTTILISNLKKGQALSVQKEWRKE